MGESYIIAGGTAGAARLSVLSEAMAEATGSLLDRVGIPQAARILDVGCGAGDVTRDLARRTSGQVIGLDLDDIKVSMASQDAPVNATFHVGGYQRAKELGPFDVIYARFLLSHLTDPADAVAVFEAALVPDGLLVVEDVEFSAHLCEPTRTSFRHFVQWYVACAHKRGADAEIGPKLPAILGRAGFIGIEARVVQPAGLTGPAKAMAALTLAGISEAVESMGVSRETLVDYISDLVKARDDPSVFMSLPRVTQAWGWKREV
ncbi:class I SAM-dependent methyltransferase [Phenylobacterium sp.]|uniref:class I SAM-dependent methyltransferase n=1 Tax=Phenylobacterium sp. TaxID=1871053 RepID=UPI00271B0257|nr:class I SAM-dependent methyltransferase [Phenylobacterium sp.]MDO8800267.1 methyltransferase domain-containing protein [Phenylobacterium sp.]